MEKESPKCIHCGGKLIKDDGERKCLQCGREWKSLPERHQFYYEHRSEIMKDIGEIGRAVALQKWQIPAGTAHKVLMQWLSPKEHKPPKIPPPTTNNHLPPLPSFSDNWSAEVQVKWLEVWGDKHP